MTSRPQSYLRKFCVLALLLASIVGGAGVAPAEDVYIPTLPKDFDKVDVYLITIGRGDDITALYGHTILRVVDRVSNVDMNFNWGIFDFNDPGFAWKFYLGDLNYMMVVSDFVPLIDHYRMTEHRRVTEDRVVLTAKQKEALMRRLIENSQPANIHYQYDQFRDNCSTKPRDHLDSAIGGKIREYYGEHAARLPLRQHIKNGAAPVWWVHMGLDTLSNDMLDRPASNWDEMFLPENLRHLLLELPAFDDAGNPVLGHNLLEDHLLIVDLPEPGLAHDPYMLFALLGGGLMALLWIYTAARPDERRLALFLGLASLGFGLWSAVWGTVMTLNWSVSHYKELKHNAGLWAVWPVDWIFLIYATALLIRRVRPSRFGILGKSTSLVASAHVIGLVLLTALWAFGGIKQDVLPLLCSTGLVGLFYYGALLRHGFLRDL